MICRNLFGLFHSLYSMISFEHLKEFAQLNLAASQSEDPPEPKGRGESVMDSG